VQNTRRYLQTDGAVAGQPMRAGDTILLVLAAANRDRTGAGHLTLGAQAHACPGGPLARGIAAAGLWALLEADLPWARLLAGLRYRPSANTRIPLFAASANAAVPTGELS
jgi:cytochrome P450